jgi:DNA-binding NarL/FixJ family response regulator
MPTGSRMTAGLSSWPAVICDAGWRQFAITASCNARGRSWCDPPLETMRYLLVDDNEPFLAASRTLLSREGVDVVGTATTAAECVRAAEELDPDVILVDVDLGAESGLALADRLAGAPAGWGVIFMSTHSAEDYAELAAEAGALGFLAKSELCRDTVEAIVKRFRRTDRRR